MKNISIPKNFKFPGGHKVAEMKEFHLYNDNPVSYIKKYQLPWLCVDGWLIIDMIQTKRYNFIITLARVEESLSSKD